MKTFIYILLFSLGVLFLVSACGVPDNIGDNNKEDNNDFKSNDTLN